MSLRQRNATHGPSIPDDGSFPPPASWLAWWDSVSDYEACTCTHLAGEHDEQGRCGPCRCEQFKLLEGAL